MLASPGEEAGGKVLLSPSNPAVAPRNPPKKPLRVVFHTKILGGGGGGSFSSRGCEWLSHRITWLIPHTGTLCLKDIMGLVTLLPLQRGIQLAEQVL